MENTISLDTKDKNEHLTELVINAQNGDKSDLAPLCAQIIQPVLYLVLRSVDNRADAEDIAQEVMLVVCQKIKTVRDPKLFRAWLSTVIANQVKKYLVRNGKDSNVFSIDDYSEIIEDKESYMPMEIIADKDAFEAVVKIIKTLPKQQEKIILLRYYDELSVTEIADLLGQTRGSVTSHLTRAHAKLKKELEKIKETMGEGSDNFLSFSAVLTEFISRDAEIFGQQNATWISEVLVKCEPFAYAPNLVNLLQELGEHAPQAAAAATTAVAGGTAAASAAAGAVAEGAAVAGAVVEGTAIAATAVGAGIAGVAVKTGTASAAIYGIIIASCVAVAGVGGWLAVDHILSPGIPEPPPTTITRYVDQELEVIGAITFETGAYGETYLNASTTDGPISIQLTEENTTWQIVNAGTGEVLRSETGGKNIAEAITHFEQTPSENIYRIEIEVREPGTPTHNFNRTITPP